MQRRGDLAVSPYIDCPIELPRRPYAPGIFCADRPFCLSLLLRNCPRIVVVVSNTMKAEAKSTNSWLGVIRRIHSAFERDSSEIMTKRFVRAVSVDAFWLN